MDKKKVIVLSTYGLKNPDVKRLIQLLETKYEVLAHWFDSFQVVFRVHKILLEKPRNIEAVIMTTDIYDHCEFEGGGFQRIRGMNSTEMILRDIYTQDCLKGAIEFIKKQTSCKKIIFYGDAASSWKPDEFYGTIGRLCKKDDLSSLLQHISSQ